MNPSTESLPVQTVCYSPPVVMFNIDYSQGLGEPVPVKVLERGLSSPECTIPTYLFLDGGRRVRCSIDMLHATKEAALREVLSDVEDALPGMRESVKAHQDHLAATEKQAEALRARLARMPD